MVDAKQVFLCLMFITKQDLPKQITGTHSHDNTCVQSDTCMLHNAPHTCTQYPQAVNMLRQSLPVRLEEIYLASLAKKTIFRFKLDILNEAESE